MKFKAEWQEWIYDEFDNFEQVNEGLLFTIEASSLEEAQKLALREAHQQIDRKRLDKTLGDFYPEIIVLTDENGIRHQLNPRCDIRGKPIAPIHQD